jgi:hypothetical protein
LPHYLAVSSAARGAEVRNGDGELARMAIVAGDLAPLSAFLRALNEDYD